MSIIVTVKIHDGIVMAADSTTSYSNNEGHVIQSYDHANKIVNLVKGFPIGVLTCGAGNVGVASIATLLKDLRQRLGGQFSDDDSWKLDASTYTMEQVALRVRKFFGERARAESFAGVLLLRVCGYSSGASLPEVWQVALDRADCPEPTIVQSQMNIGVRWEGETEALNRLILGVSRDLSPTLVSALSVTKEQAEDAMQKIYDQTRANLILPAAPVQDAIDLARYLVDTTKGFVSFAVGRAKTVGGPVEIASITKHEGYRWIERKHFYSAEFNRTE